MKLPALTSMSITVAVFACGVFVGRQTGPQSTGSGPEVSIDQASTSRVVNPLATRDLGAVAETEQVVVEQVEIANIKTNGRVLEVLQDAEFRALDLRVGLTAEQSDLVLERFAQGASDDSVYAELRPQLSALQAEQLEAYLEAKQANQWEVEANIELAQLQTVAMLDDKAKDYVFTALIELQRDADIQRLDRENPQRAYQLRLKKLSNYLTDEQMTIYANYLKAISLSH